ncbi:MAG TPA: type II toxin-antitoxin system VapB family antitoxin [Caulobacteraceae bacterium]|nr:type II toxin-antitoxin system VapB family antitoxin [Caulobacteraceae bacterium]
MTEAKLFKVGGSQAVRLPKAFRFEGDRVRIRREGPAVILEPVARTRQEIEAWLDSVHIPHFMPNGREQPPPQDRD